MAGLGYNDYLAAQKKPGMLQRLGQGLAVGAMGYGQGMTGQNFLGNYYNQQAAKAQQRFEEWKAEREADPDFLKQKAMANYRALVETGVVQPANPSQYVNSLAGEATQGTGGLDFNKLDTPTKLNLYKGFLSQIPEEQQSLWEINDETGDMRYIGGK